MNPTNGAQPAQQPAPGQRYSVSQSSQDYSAHPLISGHQSASSICRSQSQEDNTSTVSRDSLVNLRPPSPSLPTTEDPSHVYNRYHKYQKQIEAADAEHARLAALKAEQVTEATAAAAALASANAVSQTENADRSQLESQRAHEAGGQLETLEPSSPKS